MVAKLIQIYYDAKQLSKIYPFAQPYLNEKLTVFFENTPISELVMSTKAEKIAVCSWKLRDKLRWNVPGETAPRELTQGLLDSDYEVLSLTRNSADHNMLACAETWHPGFMNTFDEMMEKIGKRRPVGRIRYPINQNHFSARTTIYQNYVTNYLRPAMSALETMPEAMRDSHYTKLVPDASITHLQKHIGLSYYPLVPFLLERLFSVYVQNEGIKVQYI